MKSLSKLLPYVKPYTLFAILGPLLMCIEVAMDLLQPTIMQHIIDVGIANNDNAYVIRLGLLMLLTAFIGLIGGAGSSIYSTKAAVNFCGRYSPGCVSKKRSGFRVKIRIHLVLVN